MKKGFITFLLLMFIVLIFSTIILQILARGSENNFFNANYRSRFARYSILRQVLGLHDPGDVKTSYLGGNTTSIVLEVDEMSPLKIPDSVLDDLTAKIAFVTGKQTRYVISDTDIPFLDTVTDAQIDSIAKKYRNFSSSKNEALVYVLYLNQYLDQSTHVGSTYREDSILLFDSSLRDLSRVYPDKLPLFIESTALHEFGHLLGLDHNTQPGCLMQAVVDDYDTSATANGVVTDFCDLEKQQIKSIQNNL